jgi:hypothetical protein
VVDEPPKGFVVVVVVVVVAVDGKPKESFDAVDPKAGSEGVVAFVEPKPANGLAVVVFCDDEEEEAEGAKFPNADVDVSFAGLDIDDEGTNEMFANGLVFGWVDWDGLVATSFVLVVVV